MPSAVGQHSPISPRSLQAELDWQAELPPVDVVLEAVEAGAGGGGGAALDETG